MRGTRPVPCSLSLCVQVLPDVNYNLLTSASSNSHFQVARTGLAGVDLEDGLERRQDSMLNAWTRHFEQTG